MTYPFCQICAEVRDAVALAVFLDHFRIIMGMIRSACIIPNPRNHIAAGRAIKPVCQANVAKVRATVRGNSNGPTQDGLD